jgi:transposase
MTERFREALAALSIVLAHKAAARLAQVLLLPTSVATLRRQFERQLLSTSATPTAIGLDDFAFRRGKTYGTVIVDLESHRILDLLADRTTATVEAWLRAHPGIRIISRDRSGEYALAAARAAPQALQIADRFHLLLNAGECLERFIQRHPLLLQEAESSTLPRSARRSQAERAAQEQRKERRTTLYQRVQVLTGQGHTQHEIAESLGIARGTVIRYQRAKEVPPSAPRERPREIDRYLPYLRERWEAGEQNAHTLWEAIRAQGFTSSSHYVRRYLTQWRTEPARKGRPPKVPVLSPTVLPARRRGISARKLRWLCCKEPTELSRTDSRFLAELYQRCPELLTMQQHLTAFMALVREPDRCALDTWLSEAEQTGLPELLGFVQGLRRDYAAVVGALEYVWSQGVVEGQVNRIKTIKRQLYGRATLPVLKQHVLLSAA